MNDFWFYLREGLYHITDLHGYDHILFIAALCLPYRLSNWKQLLVLVTAFTVGHSLTLALSIYDKIIIPGKWIEFLIPVTIIIAALNNLKEPAREHHSRLYAMALFFGCIHGMGFSNFLRSMMGKGQSIVTELLAFNIGLEIGQLIIVVIIYIVTFIFVEILRVKQRGWRLFINGGIFFVSLIMALERAAEL